MTPEEAKAKATSKAIAMGEEQVAVLLKKNYQNLTVAFADKGLTLPPESEETLFKQMAKSLIDNQKFSAPTKDGTTTITIDDLDKLDKEKSLGLASSYGVDSLRKIIPTRGQLNATAGAVGEAAEENTGTIGFLGGATIMNALMGFLQWMMNGFQGNLFDTIAQVSAESMQSSVTGKLTHLREEKPEMAAMLTDKTIDAIGNQTRIAALAEVGAPDRVDSASALLPAPVALKDVKYETLDSAKLRKIHDEIEATLLGKDSAGKTMADKFVDGVNAKTEKTQAESNLPRAITYFGTPKKEDVEYKSKLSAEIVSKAIADAVTNPNLLVEGKKLSALTPEELSTYLSEAGASALVANKDKLNIWTIKGDKNIVDGVADIKTALKAGVKERYDSLQPILVAVGNAPAPVLAAATNAVGENHGVTGGKDHKGDPQVQPGGKPGDHVTMGVSS